jgi:hypothetical protein
MSIVASNLRRLAASLDPTALETLASKGLLRRAHKDIDRGIDISITGETERSLCLRVDGYEVTLPESGPVTAACSCSSVGICQHILAAVLFLQTPEEINAQNQAPVIDDAETDASCSEWMSIDREQLERWAGKQAFKAGMELAGYSNPEIVCERMIHIRFPTLNAEVHFVKGGGLDGMIASGGKGDKQKLIVAAVVSFQRDRGSEWSMPAEKGALESSGGAPRTRAEVLGSCQNLLEETLANGLSRISAANQQRWATLAVSALGVNLPRLALSLRGIGNESALAVARNAGSDLARMLMRMAHAHALCTALQNSGQNPRSDLVGLHRTQYNDVGHLDLVGAGSWPWRTASGYEGLTLLFWDPSAKCWNSWSESRPRHQPGSFDPVARYTQPGPWEGGESPRQLARSTFRLMNARRNSSRRLSGSNKSRVLITGPSDLGNQGLPIIDNWKQLAPQLNTHTHIGLKEPNPIDAIFALRPASWGERSFDAVNQVFRWALADSLQQTLLIEIDFDEFTESGIKFLENAPRDTLKRACIIGRVQLTQQGLSLHPYSIHMQNGEIININLDTVKPVPVKPAPYEEGERIEDEEEFPLSTAFPSSISRLLDELDDGLLALAEMGLAVFNPLHIGRIKNIAFRIERIGLQGLNQSLINVAIRPQPCTMLRCAYLSQLHRKALPLSKSNRS